MKFFVFVVMAALVAISMADIYMHNPRGSNNRLNERSANRRNANRAFDSQNNNRGGYNVGDKTATAFRNEAGQYDMRYFQSSRKSTGKSYLTVEWTNQHGCGGNDDSDPHKLNCQLIMQYMCEPDTLPKNKFSMRNGLDTNTQPFTANRQGDKETEASFNNRRNANVQTNRVLFESYSWYDKCRQRNRNKGLFTADQKLKGDQSIYTRQNPAGTRRGYECPEERDYFPYWHPTDWKDIAVLTSNQSQCSYYERESFNVKSKHECVEKFPSGRVRHWSKYNNEKECTENKGSWLEFNNFLETEPSAKSENACKGKGTLYFWGRRHGQVNKECLVKLPKPDCKQSPWSRVNHLGNGREGVPLNYTWELPSFPSGKDQRCILRIRYNISTDDYDPWTTDSKSNQNLAALKYSPIQQNPVVDVGSNMQGLRLAINTAQFGRTFQDRSHVFKLWSRDTNNRGLPEDKDIHNLNVRGKRGNIVQTYPAVEYDFIPNRMALNGNKDLLHIQWTGSNSHNNGGPAGDGQAGDAGEGTRGTDRSNMVETLDPLDNFPMTWEKSSMFKNAKVVWTSHQYKKQAPEDIAISMASSGYYSCLVNNKQVGCTGQSTDTKPVMNNLLNNAPASYEGMVLQFSKGEYFYTCTRNNNFSNRSQKGWLKIK